MREASVTDLMSQGKFEKALEFLTQIEGERPLTVVELVARGRCIQLAEAREDLGLPDAENAFRAALAIDPDYIPALIDLGFFYYAVEDDAAKALPLFESAVALSRALLTEAAVGKSGCLGELRSEEEAAAFLRDIHQRALILEKLDEEKSAWLEP